MIKLLFFALLFVFLSCTAQPKKPASLCPADFIAGKGIAESEQEALVRARVDISSQIQLSISAKDKYTQSQLAQNNKENIETTYNSRVKQTTELLNAQTAKQHSMKKDGNRVEAIACMSRDDAAKPYLDKLPQINDSLNFAIKKMLAQTHPLAKKEAAHTAESLKMRQIMISQILLGLERPVILPSDEPYKNMLKDYEKNFSGFKFIWEKSDEQISPILLSKISSRYKIETGSCVQGLKLVPISTETQCEENSQFGTPRCSYLPVLEGRSCSDELYFTLRGQMVYGTGERDTNDAMRKLFATIPNAPFWNQWFEELDKYK
jgi:hypothetical protein